jgi:PAS domain S-box-containing protein
MPVSIKMLFRRWWLYPALLLVLTALICAAGYSFLENAKAKALRQAVAELHHLADYKAEQVARWRLIRLNIADELAANPAVADWLRPLLQPPHDPQRRAEVLAWFKKMEGRYGYGNCAVISDAGEIVLAHKPDVEEITPEVRATLKRAFTTGTPKLSDFYLTTNAPPSRLMLVVPYQLPALAQQPAVRFALLICADPSQHLFRVLDSWPIKTESGEILLVRQEQQEAVVLNVARGQPDTNQLLRLPLTQVASPLAQAVLGRAELLDGRDHRGARVVAAMTPVEHTPWLVVVSRERDEVLAELAGVRRLTRSIMLAVLLGVCLLLGLLALNTRVHTLRQTAAVEAEFHRLMDQLTDCVFVEKLENGILMANAKACDRYGRGREELLHMTTQDLVAPEEREHVAIAMQAVRVSGLGLFDTVHLHKDGTRFPVEVSVRVTEFHEAPALVLSVRDISRRLRAMANQEQQRQLLLTLINTLPDHIFVKDKQHRFVLVNQAMLEHMGVARLEDIRGRTDDDFYPFELAAKFRADEDGIMESGQAQIGKEEIIGRQGQQQWSTSTKVPWRDASGKVIGIIGIGHDITAVRQLSAKLHAAYARSISLEVAINRSPAVLLVRSRGLDSTLEYVSENVSQWGYRSDELVGSTTLPWLHPEDREAVAEKTHLQLEGHAAEFTLNYRLLTRTGEVRWIQEHVRVAGDDVQAQSLLVDLTTHRALEEELQQAQKMETIGRLAGGIAHDFNNLLQVILGFAELLAGEVAENDRQRRDVQEIQTAAQRARDLTNQLLAFSRRQMILPTQTDLNNLLTGEKAALASVLGGQIELQLELAAELWQIKVDQTQLRQIITHLCTNAREAMPRGGRVTLSTRNIAFGEEDVLQHPDTRPGRFVCLAVADTGGGMSAEARAHLFEPFFTTKGPGAGTGLGLAMAYGIIKQHEGWIHVYSQTGLGTTFKLYIPVPAAASAAAPAAMAQAQALNGLKVLVIEDEESVRTLTCRILRARGCIVYPARTIAEAEELWRKEHGEFEVVLCDVVLPDGIGLDLVERWHAAGTKATIILSSGYTDERSRWPQIAARGFRFLQKPYPARELINLVAQPRGAA